MQAAFPMITAILLLYQAQPGLAQAVEENPAAYPSAAAPNAEGWMMGAYGMQHDASNTLCPPQLMGFDDLRFQPAMSANVLGTCIYVDDSGTGDAGVQVRRYVPGVGVSREAIGNDRELMEPDPRRGAPLFTVRMNGATTRDGKTGGRITITKVRGGFLIDCFAEGATLEVASAKMAAVCGN